MWRVSIILHWTFRKGHREGDCSGVKCVHKFSDTPPSKGGASIPSLRQGLDKVTASQRGDGSDTCDFLDCGSLVLPGEATAMSPGRSSSPEESPAWQGAEASGQHPAPSTDLTDIGGRLPGTGSSNPNLAPGGQRPHPVSCLQRQGYSRPEGTVGAEKCLLFQAAVFGLFAMSQ